MTAQAWEPADSPFQMWVIRAEEMPECVRVQVCPKCSALIATASLHAHRAWHVRQDGGGP